MGIFKYFHSLLDWYVGTFGYLLNLGSSSWKFVRMSKVDLELKKVKSVIQALNLIKLYAFTGIYWTSREGDRHPTEIEVIRHANREF